MLRRIKAEDYGVLKSLIEDSETQYQWLWYDPIDASLIEADDFSSDFSFEYTEEDFQQDLSEKKPTIYVMEEKKEVIGCVQLALIKKNHYQIVGWGMFDSTNEEAKVHALQELEKQKSIRTITVCTINSTAERWLLEYGFKKTRGCFFIKNL